MSEIKRVALTTLEPQKVSDKVNKKLCKTVRISVILPESNEDKCPEYNYKDQLAAVKRRQKLGKEIKEINHVENGMDPFAEDDDDVRRIALEMEAKYGTGMNPKKKRKGRKDDYADIGMGYDENDSFIDNTDGYDEIIPQNVTTLHGGFYINCGALEFKTDEEASSKVSSSSSESEDEEEQQSTIKKKRVLDTTDEEDSDTAKISQTEKKPKLLVKNSMQQAIKKKLFSQNKIQVKKRRLFDPQKKTVKELLREKREDLNMSIPETLVSNEENIEKDSLKENKKPMSITSVTDAIESVVKQVVEDSYGNNQNRQSLDGNKSVETTPVNKNVDISATMEGDSSQDANQMEKRELVKLPENIPPDILQIVDNLKQAALDYKGEGKKKFFTDEVNANLLSLERKCKVLGKSSRVRVYEHLAYYIKVRRETLVRRAKNLALEDEEKRVKKLLNKLKMAIDGTMPVLIANYEEESKKILQKKFSHEGQNEDNKYLKMPRRRFAWSEETKKLFKDVMFSKKKCFIFEGKQKNNLEELLVNFLRNSILPLWPEGWMYLNNLKKVFNSMAETTPSKSLPEVKKNSQDSFTDNSRPPSKHSNLTITPVSVATSQAKEDISNQITLTKVTNNDNNYGSNSVEIGNGCNTPLEMTMPNTELLKKMFDEIERNAKEAVETKNAMTTNIIKDPEKPRDNDYNSKKLLNSESLKPKKDSESKNSTSTSSSVLKETEKPKYEKDYSSKKSLNVDSVKHKTEIFNLKEPERPKYEKDYSTKKSMNVDSVKHKTEMFNLKEPERPKYEKDYSSKKSLNMEPVKHKTEMFNLKETERPKYEKDYSSKKLNVDSVKHKTEVFKPYADKIDPPKPSTWSKDLFIPHSEQALPTDYSKHRHNEDYSKDKKLAVETSKHSWHQDISTKHRQDELNLSDPIKSRYSESPSSKHGRDMSAKHPLAKALSDSYIRHNEVSKSAVIPESFKISDMLKLNSEKYKQDIAKMQDRNSDSSKHKTMDSGVIVVNSLQKDELRSLPKDERSDLSAVIPKSHCQLFDFSSDLRNKTKVEDSRPYKYAKDMSKHEIKSPDLFAEKSMPNSSSFYPDHKKHSHKYQEFSTNSNFLTSSTPKSSKSDGDDIQKVMENLRALQKLSCSPVKSDSSTSSPVSVIAYNKNFSSKSGGHGHAVQRTDSNSKGDLANNFQDDFQKQFINSLSQVAPSSNSAKSNYRCS